jgi:Uma2 family endonuclease
MNEHVAIPPPRVTRAAEGLPRRAWSVAEIEAMVAAGIIAADERFELIDGEAVPMSPKGAGHEWVKALLNEHLQRTRPEHCRIIPETTLYLDEFTFVEPDFCLVAAVPGPRRLFAADIFLAIEVADTSLAYDLARKIEVYAAHGVREVWVINSLTLVTRVHKALTDGVYAQVQEFAGDATLTPAAASDLVVQLTALGLYPTAGA